MNAINPLLRGRGKNHDRPPAHAELPRNMLQLLGKSTCNEMFNSFLKNTSITPLSVYSRLKQFGEFYGVESWNISSVEALDILEAFRKAYELIVEEDKKTGINTCKGLCKEYGIRCVAFGRDEFDLALQEADKAIYRRKAAEK